MYLGDDIGEIVSVIACGNWRGTYTSTDCCLSNSYQNFHSFALKSIVNCKSKASQFAEECYCKHGVTHDPRCLLTSHCAVWETCHGQLFSISASKHEPVLLQTWQLHSVHSVQLRPRQTEAMQTRAKPGLTVKQVSTYLCAVYSGISKTNVKKYVRTSFVKLCKKPIIFYFGFKRRTSSSPHLPIKLRVHSEVF